MPLTPIDVQQKTFGPELRGYNMDEVDDFLDEVVASLKDYDQRVRDAQDRIRALEAELSTRGEDESAISRALVSAQKQADAIVEDARAEAESIRTEATDEAGRLRSEREAERMSLVQDIARMRAMVADLKRRVLELATSVDEDLDTIDAEASDVAGRLDAAPSHDGGDALEERGDVAEAEPDAWEVGSKADDEADVLHADAGAFEADAEEAAAEPFDDAEVGSGLDPFGSERGGHLEEDHGDGDEWSDESPGDDEWASAHDDVDDAGDLEPADDEGESADDDRIDDDGIRVALDEGDDEADDGDDGEEREAAARRPWERGSV